MPVWWALSLGACFGGNGTLVGASANVVCGRYGASRGAPDRVYQIFDLVGSGYVYIGSDCDPFSDLGFRY